VLVAPVEAISRNMPALRELHRVQFATDIIAGPHENANLSQSFIAVYRTVSPVIIPRQSSRYREGLCVEREDFSTDYQQAISHPRDAADTFPVHPRG